MSTFNNEDTIKSSVKSILNQTYTDFNLLIIDDDSKDSTFDILKVLESNDKRIKIFKNSENIGLTKSLNKLINLSNKKYIARQDADDISLPKRLELQVKYMEASNLLACTTLAILMDSDKVRPKISHYLPQKIVIKRKNPFIHGTLLVKKSLMEDIGLYDENFYYSQDYKLFYDLVKKDVKVGVLKKPLYKLNTKNNISSNKREQQAYYANCVKKQILPEYIK
tara:strand:- start:2687 stop:3355 length:669 start_codon:yes stop_codon:yes gene_type:complete